MSIPESLTEKVEARIEEFLFNNSLKPENLHQIVAEFRILPLKLDWSGAWAIRPDGEIVKFFYDPPYNLEIETDPRIHNMAIFEGSQKYPELKELVPVRPFDAIDCSYCEEVEAMREKLGFTDREIGCYCGGLRWLPSTEK